MLGTVLTVIALSAAPAHADPVVAAAGDIACSPSDPDFNGGAGHSGACRQTSTSNLLVNPGFAAVLPLGDEQYEDGTLTEFRGSYDPSWGRVKGISHPVVGNHERSGSGYFDYFNGVGIQNGPAGTRGKGYYSFDIGSWHLIALNTNDKCSLVSCSAGSAQEKWLQADLAAHPAACTLAYWHEPLFSSKTRYTSSSAFWSDLYAGGAEIVLNGHVHNYERFAPQTPSGSYNAQKGVRQFVVGTGGRSLESSGSASKNSQARLSTFGVLELTLHPVGYEWSFVDESGRVLDSGSASCHTPSGAVPPPPPPPPPPTAKPTGTPAPAEHETRCTIVGTPSSDRIVGTPKRDFICALGGNDVIRGLGGNDVIYGGTGNDRLYGGAGRDLVHGRSGNDRILGGSGVDLLLGDGGRDVLIARDGRHDRVIGGRGHDRAWADGRDTVHSASPVFGFPHGY
jgi:acid phosphatase type 7